MNGLYIDVFYKNVLVCRGKIIRTKQNDGAHEMYLVSIDNKYFFNLSHPYVTFIFTSPDNETYIRLPEKVVKWRDCPTNQDEYVYEENDINELDEEVKHLVAALNQLQYIELMEVAQVMMLITFGLILIVLILELYKDLLNFLSRVVLLHKTG